MTHTKEEELKDAGIIFHEVIEDYDFPPWHQLTDDERTQVIQELNERLDVKYGDKKRYYIFSTRYDTTDNLQLVAVPIGVDLSLNDRVPGGQYADEL